MGTWSITPENRTAEIKQDGTVTVNANSGSEIKYTVRYVEEGHCGEYTFTQYGSGVDCDATGTLVGSAGGKHELVGTYTTECDVQDIKFDNDGIDIASQFTYSNGEIYAYVSSNPDADERGGKYKVTFKNGTTADFHVWQNGTGGGGGGGTNPVISFGVNITNAHGSNLTLDGRLRFVLGNPDHNGTYYGGYMGDYLRTDNIYFSPTSIVLEAGETKRFTNLSWRDADTGCGLGETSPLNPGRLPILDDKGGIAYARNVLMYIGGRSDLVLCDNLSSSIIFQEGGLYDIVIR